MKTAYVVLTPSVELLDFAGPVQVLHEANSDTEARYDLRYVGFDPSVRSEQGVRFVALEPLPESVQSNALVLVAGSRTFRDRAFYRSVAGKRLVSFLRRAYAQGAHVASVCVGAYALAHAGLLRDRECTTHWNFVEDFRQRFPSAIVRDNRLYVLGERVSTSAGISSGIDLALAIVERDYGSRAAAAVAREVVVANRRSGSDVQLNAYFARRDHTYHGVHLIQDWLIEHVGEPFTLEDVAAAAGMSVRTMTRHFKEATGTSVKAYVTQLRLERSRAFLRDPVLTLDDIAERCGFADARQLRRLWNSVYGHSPTAVRAGSTP